MGVGESRYITKLNQTFDWISVDADRNMLECTPQDWGAGVVIHAKEQRILSTGYYKNSVEHKYSYNAVQYKIPAYGWSSTKDHIGVWFINPTIEYLSGGASKQELVCHFDANDDPDPIILDYWRGTPLRRRRAVQHRRRRKLEQGHRPDLRLLQLAGRSQDASQADLATLAATAGNPTVPPAWKDNATALWQDALRQAKNEKAQWPYDWVNGVDYPHKDERGNVTGQLVLNDPQAATTKLPHLTVGLAHPDYAAACRADLRGGRADGRSDRPGRTTRSYYQFWNDGSEDGKFTITNVRPGTYTLHAFADGVLGEFAQTNITVEAGKTLDLGKIEWKPVRYGKQVWEIGYPDRTGGKFYKGDGENYWLWGWCVRYPRPVPERHHLHHRQERLPQGLVFRAGAARSCPTPGRIPKPRIPLNQRFGWVKAGTPGEDMWRTIGRGRATTWTIKFNMDKTRKARRPCAWRWPAPTATAGWPWPSTARASAPSGQWPPTPCATTPTRASGRNAT